jgi:hypothetical protein
MKRHELNNGHRLLKLNAVRKMILAAAGLMMLYTSIGCKKMLEVDPAGSQLLSSSVFTDSVTVQSAIAGMYLNLNQSSSPYSAALSYLPGFSADEMVYVSGLGGTYDGYINNGILSNNEDLSLIWSVSYNMIYNANAIIEGIASSKNISLKFQNQAMAEARFIRAYCLFHLVTLFGDVPLVLTTDVNANSVMGRTPSTEVYAQIVSDLKFAQSTLPADYTIAGGSRTRANKWAATALLARVDLYLSNWADAEADASAVISNSGLFNLNGDLNKVFTPDNTEAIWQVYNDANGYTVYAFMVLPNAVTQIPTFVLTPSLVSAFEAGDARKLSWTNTLVYNGINYTYPYKYKSIDGGANAEYLTMLRLAEQFLIRAEARVKQNNISGAVADINRLRARARTSPATLPDYANNISSDAALAAIAKERRIELFGEQGHRWFDLKRTGTVNTVIGALKPTYWKPAAALYPIPLSEISRNNKLKQNPGYN